MKKLLTNVWNMPASTVAGGILAVCIWASSGLAGLPEPWVKVAAGLAVLLGALYPKPLKPKPKS